MDNVACINTVFILGAGASAQSGVPVMSNFLDIAEQLWRTGKAKESEEHFQAVFEGRSKLQAVFAKAKLDILNVEDVFAAFEMGRTLNALPGYDPDQIDSLIDSTKILIIKTIGYMQQFRKNSKGENLSPIPYDAFAELIKHLQEKSNPRHKVSIITFNYDVGCDFALYRNNLKYTYFLGDFDGSQDYLPILKLHGSLNWGVWKSGAVVPGRLEDFFAKYDFERGPNQNHWILDIGSRLNGFRDFEDLVEPIVPFLVPPTWNKTQYYDGISRIWQKAASVLSEADNIFVSGYSLPKSDAFFRYLYALGTVGEGLIQKFWVFDIEDKGNGVDNRFRDLLGQSVLPRYSYFKRSFTEAITLIQDAFS